MHALLLAVFIATEAACAAPGRAGRRTEAMDSILWTKAQWISPEKNPAAPDQRGNGTERAADGAAWFVSDIKNDKKLRSARWMTSGLGVYSLYVNGKSVGEEILKPGYTHYKKTKLSFTYDVTDAVSRKKNAVNTFAAQVTPGWWADKIITSWESREMYGTNLAFRSVIELTYTDGSREYIGTNTADWKAGIAGPVRHAAIYDGEEYDARKLPGFIDRAPLSAPVPNNEFKGGIYPSDGAEIYRRDDLALSPAETYIWQGVMGKTDSAYGKIIITQRFDKNDEIKLSPGETLVVDFGQNCAAVPSFVFRAAEGTTLKCRPGELLNDGNGAVERGMDGPEGSVHRLNLRTPDTGMLLDYTFGHDKGYVSYSPQCTFYGYRYISLTADGEVSFRSIKSVPVSSVTAALETGRLTTGNDLINRLISNTIWGMRSNYLSVPTDCPQRNERLGWTADAQVFAETGTYFADTRAFFHKWLRDLRDTQSEAGGYPGVAPFGQYASGASETARVGWADAGIIVPWTVWKQFGDTGVIDESWDSMEKFMHLISEAKYNHEALKACNGDYQWADWLSYEPLESCGGLKDYTDENGNTRTRPEALEYWNYLSACYWLSDARMMADMARATGRDSGKYDRMAADASSYLRERFLNDDGTFKNEILNTMQTPALFALKTGIVGGKAKENMIARLRANFASHGNCLQTGFLGTSVLMPALTENGMADLAYELLFQRKNPSWLYSVDNGATTIWERWNSYTLDKGMGPRGMNSFNHYAYGCVCGWMWTTMAGIASDTSNPGFKRIVLKPIPDRRLGFVDAEYASAAGLIKSRWRYEGNKWIWQFTIPDGSVADVTIPGETQSKEYRPGSYTIKIPAI